ncbi:MAG: two-component system OmpR family response regulator, partial [Hydrogenophaga sp.]
EPTLRAQLRTSLADAGYAADEADNGRDAHFLGDTEPFDAVVLDLGLPVLDGLSVLKRWRDAGRSMPVLILTARDNWSEKVAGIDAGADHYLTKPFQMEELLARLRALALDTRSGRVTLAGLPVTLTSHERKVLDYLMHRPGAVVSRTELTEHIYAQDFDRDSNTIEVFVGRLRKKLPTGLIETVRGQGYRLMSTDPTSPR